MIKPINVPRDEFPKSGLRSEGMKILRIRPDNDQMDYIRDIEYIRRGNIPLHIQLILPDNIDRRTPVVVYVTGSAFRWQNIPQTIPRLCLLVNKGAAVASVQYRGSETAAFPAQALDVKAAVRFMRVNAEKYGLNPDNLFLMGDSSGGHTALMAGLTSGINGLEEDIFRGVSSNVNGIIDFYGPTDISKMNDEPSTMDHTSPDSPEGSLLGGKNVLENSRLVKPTVIMDYISKERDIPPLLILHGTNDELVPFGQSCMLYDRLISQGKTASFYAVDGAHHGGKEFWSEEILGIVMDFLKQNSC